MHPPHHEIRIAWWHEGPRDKEVPVGDGIYKKVRETWYREWITGWDRSIPQAIKPTHWMPLPDPPEFPLDLDTAHETSGR